MQAIHKHIHNPMGDQLNTHKTLLDALAADLRLKALSGLHTSIIKVKFYVRFMEMRWRTSWQVKLGMQLPAN